MTCLPSQLSLVVLDLIYWSEECRRIHSFICCLR